MKTRLSFLLALAAAAGLLLFLVFRQLAVESPYHGRGHHDFSLGKVENSSSQCDQGLVRCFTHLQDIFPLSKKDELFLKNDKIQKMFMLETSLTPMLSPRVACAMESANLNSDLDQIIVLMRSPFLNLTDNTTCQLYMRFAGRGIEFRRIVPEAALKGTPLEEVYNNGTFANSKHLATHLSDGLRMAYIYKYGGWYADTDFVFIKSLRGMQDIVTASAVSKKLETSSNFHVSNGLLNLKNHHQLSLAYMEEFKRKFRGEERTEVGPSTFTNVFRKVCHIKEGDKVIELSGLNECLGITVKHPNLFYPFRPYQVNEMFPPNETKTTAEEWEKRVGEALTVHFFGGITRNWEVSKDPTKDAYSYFAKTYCPVSFDSARVFS